MVDSLLNMIPEMMKRDFVEWKVAVMRIRSRHNRPSIDSCSANFLLHDHRMAFVVCVHAKRTPEAHVVLQDSRSAGAA